MVAAVFPCDYILSQLGRIGEIAQIFNIPQSDIQYAFEVGHEVVLTDSIWSKLQNTKSFHINSLEDAVLRAKKRNIDVQPYITAIKAGEQLPLPLVMSYGEDKYFLVAGEVELSLYRALKVQPIILLAVLNLKQMAGSVSGVNEAEMDDMKLKDEQVDLIAQVVKNAV